MRLAAGEEFALVVAPSNDGRKRLTALAILAGQQQRTGDVEQGDDAVGGAKVDADRLSDSVGLMGWHGRLPQEGEEKVACRYCTTDFKGLRGPRKDGTR